MHRQQQRQIKHVGLIMVAVWMGVVGTACKKSAAPPPKQEHTQGENATPATEKPAVDPRPTPPSQPLTEEAIAALRARIKTADRYSDRVELRRTLMNGLCRDKHIKPALAEFNALLDDVERQEGRDMAVRVAFSDAGTWKAHEKHHAAIGAYGVLLERYGETGFAAEALMHMGSCHLERREYAEAEQAWRRLIEEYDETPSAPWGWRKLALAQLLQGQYEVSLSTLAMMAKKYKGTHFGEYAQVRQGYVLMAANRLEEAKLRYKDFLRECSHSKYCRLAEQQLDKLDEAIVLARANGERG